MAVKYVDDSRTSGSGSGDSWANAYTAYSSVSLSATGDIIYIASGHGIDSSDNALEGKVSGEAGPIHVSVDATGDPTPPDNTDLLAGADLQSSSLHYNVANSTYVYGLTLRAQTNDRDVYFNPSNEIIITEKCTFICGRDGTPLLLGGHHSHVIHKDVTIDSLDGGVADNVGGVVELGGTTSGTNMTIFGLTIGSNFGYRDYIIYGGARSHNIDIHAADLTNWGTTGGTVAINQSTAHRGIVRFFNCKFPHGATFSMGTRPGNPRGRIELIGCGLVNNTDQEQGAITDWYGDMEVWGGGLASRAVYRSGGATPPHQTNPISWEVIPTSNCSIGFGFRLWTIKQYYSTTGATKTIKIHYLASRISAAAEALDDSQIVMHIRYYDATGVLTGYENTFSGILSTLGGETDHTEETGETWTTTNADANTTKRSVSHTTSANIAQEGFIEVDLEVVDIGNNDRIFIDPVLVIS